MFILERKHLEKRGAVFIAESEEMELWELPKKSGRIWRNIYMRLKKPAKSVQVKRAWWLGWNGERLSRCRDAKLLKAHRPEIYQWVEGVLKNA